MFKFLRFEIGGVSALLWGLLFLAPYLNIDAVTKVDSAKTFALILGSVTLSIPLGNYIHQFSDAIFNPFGRRRLLFWRRAVIQYLEEELGESIKEFHDRSFQAVLVFSKASDVVTKKSGKTKEDSITIKAEILREEISNRYSYYYARLENGLVAPVVGFAIAFLIRMLFAGTNYLTGPSFPVGWLIVPAVIVGLAMLWRIPQLFRELDDLEVCLVRSRRPVWPKA
jgi:hypothetical protein